MLHKTGFQPWASGWEN